MGTVLFIAKSLLDIVMSPFQSDMDIMTDEAKKIFSNEEDKKKYMDAIDFLRSHPDQKETTIDLSTKEKITLVS